MVAAIPCATNHAPLRLGNPKYLRYSNPTVPGELLLDLLAGVGVGEVRVEVLVEQLERLFGEVAPLPTRVEETERGSDVTVPGTR